MRNYINIDDLTIANKKKRLQMMMKKDSIVIKYHNLHDWHENQSNREYNIYFCLFQ